MARLALDRLGLEPLAAAAPAAARRLVARGGEAEDLLEDLGDALGRAVADVLGGLARLLGLAAGDDRGLAGGAEALLELFEALQRERQLGLHGDDPLVARRRDLGARGLGGLAGARELGAQELEAARGGLGHVADLAQLGPQRGGALLGGGGGLARLEHGLAEAVDVRAEGVEALAAGAELGLERGGALVDGGEALGEPLPSARLGGVGGAAADGARAARSRSVVRSR